MSEDAWHKWAGQLATGMARVDADLRLAWINPALAEGLQLGPRTAVGQSLAVLLGDGESMLQARRVLREQTLLQLRDLRLMAGADHEVRADVTLQPVDDGLLLEVHLLSPVLASSDSPLSATLRGFAHEVKNPLAGLRGAAQLLQRRLDGAELQSLAGMIIDEADRLAALANRLLHHDGAPRLEQVNVHQLLGRLIDLLRAEPSCPPLHADYDPSVPDLWADADRLQQILLNLGRNALQAGASKLTLRTRVEHGVRLGDTLRRMALRVDVIDDGPGVPPALRDNLFQPLVSSRADGSGLGLALAREMAHEHGGELRYTSQPGHTVFSLYLPLERTHEREHDARL